MNVNAKLKASFAKWAIYSFLLLIMLVLQNTLSLHISNICLVLPAVVVISLNDDTDVGLVLGGVFGMLWDVTSGTLPISRGGTGASTAAAARTALDVPSNASVVKAGDSTYTTPGLLLDGTTLVPHVTSYRTCAKNSETAARHCGL